jgi:hypothetical protein
VRTILALALSVLFAVEADAQPVPGGDNELASYRTRVQAACRKGQSTRVEASGAPREQAGMAAERYCDCALGRLSESDWRLALELARKKQHADELSILARHFSEACWL